MINRVRATYINGVVYFDAVDIVNLVVSLGREEAREDLIKLMEETKEKYERA